METVRGPARPLLVVGGNLALDLANTVDEPGLAGEFDHLGDPGAAISWTTQLGLVDRDQAGRLARGAEADPGGAAVAVRRLRRLREAVQLVFGAVIDRSDVPEAALGRVTRAAGEALVAARFEAAGDRRRPHWDLDDLGAVGRPAAYAALELLTHGPLDRVKRCPACPWLYVDRSKNGSRRWCTMDDCGKAAKMERYVAKRAAGRLKNHS